MDDDSIHQWNENGQEMSRMKAIRKMQSHSKTKDRSNVKRARVRRTKRKMRVTLIEANEFLLFTKLKWPLFSVVPNTQRIIATQFRQWIGTNNENRWSMGERYRRGCSRRIKWKRRNSFIQAHIATADAAGGGFGYDGARSSKVGHRRSKSMWKRVLVVSETHRIQRMIYVCVLSSSKS